MEEMPNGKLEIWKEIKSINITLKTSLNKYYLFITVLCTKSILLLTVYLELMQKRHQKKLNKFLYKQSSISNNKEQPDYDFLLYGPNRL